MKQVFGETGIPSIVFLKTPEISSIATANYTERLLASLFVRVCLSVTYSLIMPLIVSRSKLWEKTVAEASSHCVRKHAAGLQL